MKNGFKLLMGLLMLPLLMSGCSSNSNGSGESGSNNSKPEISEDGSLKFVGSSVSAANTSISGDIVIPESFNGQSITTIPKDAFKNCNRIKSIVVPDTVTSIAVGAFAGCIQLESITIPFCGTAPDRESYGGHCARIFGKDEYVGSTEVKSYHADYDNYYEIYYVPSSLRKVTVTNATTLVYGAFHNMSMLTEINLNDDIIAIGTKCFAGCKQITTVNLPNIFTIPKQCFSGCTKLNNFVIGEKVTKIEEKAFESCMNLLKINSETDGEFIIPENVTGFGVGAFKNCLRVSSITLPFIGTADSNTSYGGHFSRIFGQDEYTGSTKVKSYHGDYDNYFEIYYVPSGLRSVTITNSTHVVYGAFQNVSMITSLRINKEAQSSVGPKAFDNCVQPVWF